MGNGLGFLVCLYPGADPGFQVRRAHLKKLPRAEGGAKFVGVFRVKNHDFTPKNHIFSDFRGGARLSPPGSAPDICIAVENLIVKRRSAGITLTD